MKVKKSGVSKNAQRLSKVLAGGVGTFDEKLTGW
jgi:hypothetical protein